MYHLLFIIWSILLLIFVIFFSREAFITGPDKEWRKKGFERLSQKNKPLVGEPVKVVARMWSGSLIDNTVAFHERKRTPIFDNVYCLFEINKEWIWVPILPSLCRLKYNEVRYIEVDKRRDERLTYIIYDFDFENNCLGKSRVVRKSEI